MCVCVRVFACKCVRTHAHPKQKEGGEGGESLSEAHSALGSSANEISQ